MPNKNYEAGRRREYYVKNNKIPEEFTIKQRTAGSHSPFDIISIDPENKEIELTQVKPKDMRKTEIDKIKKENEALKGNYNVQFKVR